MAPDSAPTGYPKVSESAASAVPYTRYERTVYAYLCAKRPLVYSSARRTLWAR